MAVVQISKIQVRRGQKNTGIGIPQLSSAEFAWAVDSQELYIGNGSVAEGAPYVGNTKVLTEHDNILELASSYQFAESDPTISYSVSRSLQSKLDEYVSVADFGAVGDGSTDNVEAFENALNQLFRNADEKFRKTLLIPNGTYLFLSDLRIPSNAILQGETRDGVILNFGANNIRFVTSAGIELSGFTSVNRPRNVSLGRLTFSRSTGQLVLTGLGDSIFTDIKFKGEYVLGDSVLAPASESAAVQWQNDINDIKTTDIVFEKCLFDSLSMGVKCTQTSVFETTVKFIDTKFFVCDIGVYISGLVGQTNTWTFTNCSFEETYKQGFISTHGRGTLFDGCNFKNCGNGTNSAATPAYDIITFGESVNNRIINCTTNRHQEANITSVGTTAGSTEASGASLARFVDRNYSDIYLSDSFKPLIALSAFNRFTYIDYTLKLSSHTRAGRLTVTIDEDLSVVAITDEYQYSPSLVTDPGGSLMTNFEFNAELKDNDADSGIETILVSYKNPLATGSTGDISYSISYGV